eukprot:m.94404 g.94404  ORF g.94404 m.94404 type:complete len:90 (+) comp36813_c0_seq2:631-900(+)
MYGFIYEFPESVPTLGSCSKQQPFSTWTSYKNDFGRKATKSEFFLQTLTIASPDALGKLVQNTKKKDEAFVTKAVKEVKGKKQKVETCN